MTIKPMSFNVQMVRALIDGRKTQTRRIVNCPPFDPCDDGIDIEFALGNVSGAYYPGDTVWIREPGKVDGHRLSYGKSSVFVVYSDGKGSWVDVPERFKSVHGACSAPWALRLQGIPNGIFREAARLFYTVTDVRAQRVQDITEKDAISEGIAFDGTAYYVPGTSIETGSARAAFFMLWNSIYVKRGPGWDQNPWVLAYTLKRCDKPQGWPEVR